MNEAPFLFDYKSACSELTQTWRELDVDSNSRPSVLVEIDVSFGLAQCVLLDGELSYADLTRAAVLEFVRFMLKLVHHEDWMVTMIVRSEGPLGNEAVVLSPEILEELSSELSPSVLGARLGAAGDEAGLGEACVSRISALRSAGSSLRGGMTVRLWRSP